MQLPAGKRQLRAGVRGDLVVVISVKTDGRTDRFDIPDAGPGNVVRDGHVPRPHRPDATHAEKLRGWFPWIWFAGVPFAALAGIALVLLRRKSRVPVT